MVAVVVLVVALRARTYNVTSHNNNLSIQIYNSEKIKEVNDQTENIYRAVSHCTGPVSQCNSWIFPVIILSPVGLLRLCFNVPPLRVCDSRKCNFAPEYHSHIGRFGIKI